MKPTKQKQQGRMEQELQKNTTSESLDTSVSRETCSNKVTCEVVEGTPFLLLENNENYFLAIGKYRMETYFTSKEEAIKQAKKIDWENMCFFMSTLRSEMLSFYKTLKNNEN